MIRQTTLAVGLVLLVAACGQMPTSPDTGAGMGAALAQDVGSGGSATTRGRNPASPATFNFRFINGLNSQHPNDISGEPVASEVSGGPIQLTGTVSGAPGSRVFTLAGGPLTLTIQNVRRDHAGAGCGAAVEELLRGSKQLVGVPLTGTAAKVVVNEADGTANLEVNGVAGADGQTWNVFLFSTSGSHAQITDSGGVITVVQNYGEVGFRVPAPRGNKNLEAYGACKLYFGFDLTPTP
jgi:hypothetical protein